MWRAALSRPGTWTARALREAFDGSFAEPRVAAGAARLESFLLIDVGGSPYAMRLSEIVSLHAHRRIVPIPGPASELLGVAGFRGTLAPVYDLRALLGHARPGIASWMVLAHAPQVVGLAFDAFRSHLRLPPDRVSAADASLGATRFVGAAIRADEALVPLIHLPSLLEAIVRRARDGSSPKEP